MVAEKFLEDKSQSYYAFNFYFRLGEFYQRTNNIQKSILAFEKAYQKSLGLDLLSNVVEITKELSEEYKNILYSIEYGERINAYLNKLKNITHNS